MQIFIIQPVPNDPPKVRIVTLNVDSEGNSSTEGTLDAFEMAFAGVASEDPPSSFSELLERITDKMRESR